MRRFVVDASVALAWCLDDEDDPYADLALGALQKTTSIGPGHLFLEVMNGLLMAERRGRTQPADTQRAVSLLKSLRIDLDPQTADRASNETIALARLYGLTVYDAAYLELCIREGLPIATSDRRLSKACEKAGVELFLSDATA